MGQQKYSVPTGGLFLMGGLALFIGFSMGLDAVSQQAHRARTEHPEQPEHPESVDFYQQALNYGMQAAIAAQTAETSQEWETVSALWSKALRKLQSIPKNDPDYAAVRKKILEYETNQEYAEKLQQLKSP